MHNTEEVGGLQLACQPQLLSAHDARARPPVRKGVRADSCVAARGLGQLCGLTSAVSEWAEDLTLRG